MSAAGDAPRKGRPAGLGRGLSALLGDVPGSTDAPAERSSAGGGVRMLPVTALAPHPGQPRRHFDDAALDDLAQSIAQRGLIQPIVVRPHGKDYQIVAGERRWRAAQRARLHEVPVIVRTLDDAETLEIALVENIQRQDLSAIEEADAYAKLIEAFGHTQEALAKRVNKSRSHVANLLRLLDLPLSVQKMVIDGTLSMGQARAIINAPDPEALAQQVVARGLSVRETERLAKGVTKSGSGGHQRRSGSAGQEGDADIAALERQLGDVLGLNVRIAHGSKGGTLTLSYATLDQLDMVCQRLSGDHI
ncbi:ParB/RepB/Spo0J family partition protein [Sphingomonas baiyangensis]|uniref:ParB/RepB/Spo0J family partition protein n=1 Tax=Sphingomonas baiyangensis TaxID=2572576 RepID=A0A4U1L5U0_9SPHN|nr:ParB/RepB/Spo0J family partition protein [Sphingomonas baiyangensis]TKD51934.1 ParB/RepB/Spo0J family partition protein [Sphingomonas baiyangensis]